MVLRFASKLRNRSSTVLRWSRSSFFSLCHYTAAFNSNELHRRSKRICGSEARNIGSWAALVLKQHKGTSHDLSKREYQHQ